MNLKYIFVLILLITVANGHAAMIIGLITKILGAVVKVSGPIAMEGFKTFLGFITKGLGGAAQGGAHMGGGLGGLLGGLGGGHKGGGIGFGGGGHGGGQGHGKGGFGFGGGAHGGGKGGGKGGFGFGGGSHGGGKGGFGGGGKGGFGGGGKGGGRGGNRGDSSESNENEGFGGGAKGAGGGGGGGFMGSMISGLQGIFGQYAKIFGGLVGGSRSLADTIQSTIETGAGTFFKIFGGLAASQQNGIGNMFAESFKVLKTVINLKLNIEESAISFIVSEIKVLKDTLEKQFSNAAELFGSLGSKAPKIAGTVSVGFKLARKEYDHHYARLDAESKLHADKMMGSLKEARSKVGKLLEAATEEHKNDMGILFHLMRNVHALTLAIA